MATIFNPQRWSHFSLIHIPFFSEHIVEQWTYLSEHIVVFTSGLSKFVGRQPLKNLTWSGLLKADFTWSTNFTWSILEYFVPNDNLSYRHWKKLMELTKMNFDLNPETFTLQNMFAMELHRFIEIIQDIVSSAVKELSIEKGISEVSDTWGAMKFSVHKYMKGTQERGKMQCFYFVDSIFILDTNKSNVFRFFQWANLAGISMFKVNNSNTDIMCEMA